MHSAEGRKDSPGNAIPQSLDDIVRINRDKLSIQQTSPDAIRRLARPIIAPEVRHTLTDWTVISFHAVFEDGGTYERTALLGTTTGPDPVAWITSQVEGIDLDTGRVLTKNSVYGIQGQRSTSEPSLHQLLHVCYAAHYWNFGKMFGIPHVFY